MSTRAVRGTRDLFGDEIIAWQRFEQVTKRICDAFSYEEFRTPIFEYSDLFTRGVGEDTDIVGKEMYTFLDRGGDSITLRPEMTAPIVRACIEHSLLHHNPIKRLWYSGPQFRYDRPQKGRYRQFHQFGAECIGAASPESDAEVILLACEVLRQFGVTNYTLEINSLATSAVRSEYRKALVEFLGKHVADLSDDSKRRLQTNPLRVLDSKESRDKDVVLNAPRITTFLDEESTKHFNAVCTILDSAGITYLVEPLLVRGLDYYNHTVFEFTTTALGSQSAIGGGGRYDPLFAMIGGDETPAVGFSLGVERVLLLHESEHGAPLPQELTGIYLCTVGEEAVVPAQLIALRLRRKGYQVRTDLLRRSVKSQLKDANRAGVRWTVVLGSEELAQGVVTVKDMSNGEQHSVASNQLETVIGLP